MRRSTGAAMLVGATLVGVAAISIYGGHHPVGSLGIEHSGLNQESLTARQGGISKTVAPRAAIPESTATDQDTGAGVEPAVADPWSRQMDGQIRDAAARLSSARAYIKTVACGERECRIGVVGADREAFNAFMIGVFHDPRNHAWDIPHSGTRIDAIEVHADGLVDAVATLSR